MNCSVGITSWCWPDFGVGSMPEIKKAGLDALQLQVGDWEDGLPLSDKALQKEYAEAAAAAGLKLLPVSVNTVCRHPFTEGLDTPDGAIALKALEAGACFAVVNRSVEADDPRLIKVDDTLEALKAEGINIIEVPDKAPWVEAVKATVEANINGQDEAYQQILSMK